MSRYSVCSVKIRIIIMGGVWASIINVSTDRLKWRPMPNKNAEIYIMP